MRQHFRGLDLTSFKYKIAECVYNFAEATLSLKKNGIVRWENAIRVSMVAISCLEVIVSLLVCSRLYSTALGVADVGDSPVWIQAEVPSDGQIVFSSELHSAWRLRGLNRDICSGGCAVSIQLLMMYGESTVVLQTANQMYEPDDFHETEISDEGLSIEIPYSGLESYMEFALNLSVSFQTPLSRLSRSVHFRTGIYPKLSVSTPEDEPNMDDGACRLELQMSERLSASQMTLITTRGERMKFSWP